MPAVAKTDGSKQAAPKRKTLSEAGAAYGFSNEDLAQLGEAPVKETTANHVASPAEGHAGRRKSNKGNKGEKKQSSSKVRAFCARGSTILRQLEAQCLSTYGILFLLLCSTIS